MLMNEEKRESVCVRTREGNHSNSLHYQVVSANEADLIDRGIEINEKKN